MFPFPAATAALSMSMGRPVAALSALKASRSSCDGHIFAVD